MFAPAFGAVARPLSGVTLILVLALAVGWFVLTLGAETLLSIKAGRPASDIASAFTFDAIMQGELFGVAAMFVALAPVIFARFIRP